LEQDLQVRSINQEEMSWTRRRPWNQMFWMFVMSFAYWQERSMPAL